MTPPTYGHSGWDKSKVNSFRVAAVLDSNWTQSARHGWLLWEETTEASDWCNSDLFEYLADVVGYRLDTTTGAPVLLHLDYELGIPFFQDTLVRQLLPNR